jgi:ribose-phosphate pyrophosphokinase
MKIILGPASEHLGERVAKLISVETVSVVFKTFPDGESYVRLEGEVQKEDVAIVQTTSPPQDSRLIQLALMASAARKSGARSVTAIVPYLAYARQDRAFLRGEAVSIETIANMLKVSGVDNLITVNVHQEKILDRFPFPARSVSAVPLLAEYFKQRGFGNAFALAPDEGAMHIADEARKVLSGRSGYLEKHRDRYTGQLTVEKRERFDVKGRTVIIFDDIISTGDTIASAAKIMKEHGAERVYAACVHTLLIGDAEKRILDAGVEEIVGTDSVPSRVGKVSLAPLIGEELKERKSG